MQEAPEDRPFPSLRLGALGELGSCLVSILDGAHVVRAAGGDGALDRSINPEAAVETQSRAIVVVARRLHNAVK